MEKLELASLCCGPVIILLIWGILTGIDIFFNPSNPIQTEEESPSSTSLYDNLEYGSPGDCDQIIDREGYALGYIEDWEQPSWVSYRLTAEEALSHNADRGIFFVVDSEIKTGSATLEDYANSGYDRGHLAPAADMQWSDMAMRESFLMSNMSPQLPVVNRGIWKKVEKAVRDFAIKEKSIFVVTGPIFYPNTPTNRIGRNNVAVPHAYYKVVYDETPPEKSIGFIVPNSDTNGAIMAFAVTIGDVEKATNLHFFWGTRKKSAIDKEKINPQDWE